MTSDPPETVGTLQVGEPHPAARDALHYLKGLGSNLLEYQEAFASTAIEGNRLAEICSETLSRLLASEPVSDRYLLGLAWTVREIEVSNSSPSPR